MRHGISGRKLNRKSSHRMALLKNLTKSLILNEQIKTTLPKAKSLRPFAEKVLTCGKNPSLHSKRKVYSILRDNILVNKIFGELSKRYSNRNGGYIRILKAGFRHGDSSPMAIVELVDRDINAKGLSDKERLKNLTDEKKSEPVQEKLKTQPTDKDPTTAIKEKPAK
tara:strand:- start:403 stop:903 length:501 start_codon:yes stop_codon:yes gene_type:complete